MCRQLVISLTVISRRLGYYDADCQSTSILADWPLNVAYSNSVFRSVSLERSLLRRTVELGHMKWMVLIYDMDLNKPMR